MFLTRPGGNDGGMPERSCPLEVTLLGRMAKRGVRFVVEENEIIAEAGRREAKRLLGETLADFVEEPARPNPDPRNGR